MSARITQQQLESYLWGAATLLRGTIDAGDYKQFIFPLLFYKRLCDVFDEETRTALAESDGDQQFSLFPENHCFQIPLEAHWRRVRQTATDVGRILQSALRAIETANPDKLYGIFGDAQWTNKDRLSDAMLHDLVEHFSALELTVANLPEDELGQGYEYLIKKFADDSGHTAAEFYTNRTVVHLMTEILQPQPGESIYDPTCGSGGMLLSAIAHLRRHGQEWRNVRLYGQERNLMTSSIARMNCFLHGIEDFRIERGDSLAEPKLVQGDRLMRFDVVLANPPYSIKQWDRDAFASDPWGRNLYGTPPQGRADYAFWQHILQSLAPKTGRCAILFPHGVLFRDIEDEMRRKLIEADLIEAVVGLGPNLFYNSSMPACIVICRTAKGKARREKVLFINAANELTRERAQSFLTDDHIERVVMAYQRFKDEPGFARVVGLEEIRAKNGNLNISVYVTTQTVETRVEIARTPSLPAVLDSWLESRTAVADALHGILPGTVISAPDGLLRNVNTWRSLKINPSWPRVRLGDVIVKTEATERNPIAAGLDRYLLVEHLDADSLRIRRWGDVSDGSLPPTFYKVFRKGQVLYPTRNPHLRRAAFADFDGICGEKTLTLSPTSAVDSLFLPFIFQVEAFIAYATNMRIGSTNPHVRWRDIADFEFALPPLDQQRRIAEILWAIDEGLGSGDRLVDALADYRQSLLDSLAHEYSAAHALIPLDSVIAPGRPICYGILKPGLDFQGGIPVIKVRDYPDGDIHEEDLLRTTPEIEAPFKRSRLQKGDLRLSIRGTIGRLAEVPPSLDSANITQDTARLSIAPEHNRYFIRALLESHFIQNQILTRITGLAVKGINIDEVRKFGLPLPPRPKQDKIAQQLSSIALAQRTASVASERRRNLLCCVLESLLGETSQ